MCNKSIMPNVCLWERSNATKVVNVEIPDDVVKICCLDNYLFLLTKSNKVYRGEVNNEYINLGAIGHTANDIACNLSLLYIVNEFGCIFKASPDNCEQLQEIVLKEKSRTCVHGCQSSGCRIKVKSIAIGETYILYLEENGELWACGSQSQLGICTSTFNSLSEVPEKVSFFRGRYVVSVSCGADFGVAVSQVNEGDDLKGSVDVEDDVFVASCGVCMGGSLSITSPSSSESCPLGVPLTSSELEIHRKTCETVSDKKWEESKLDVDNLSQNHTFRTDDKCENDRFEECNSVEQELNSDNCKEGRELRAESDNKGTEGEPGEYNTDSSCSEKDILASLVTCNEESDTDLKELSNNHMLSETKEDDTTDGEKNVESESSPDTSVRAVSREDEASDESKKDVDVTKSESDEISDDNKKGIVFINTEAARQFLARQLSWVSGYGGGEDESVPNMETSFSHPTRLLKQNVSHVANIVYEGVKTVQDKVVTFSRHVSGSSDFSEGPLHDSFEELSTEDLKVPSVKKSEFDSVPSLFGWELEEMKFLQHSVSGDRTCWSSDVSVSDKEEERSIALRADALIQAGKCILDLEVWSWGAYNYGQLGIGDMLTRTEPSLISRISYCGVIKIVCGLHHCLALTVDGRVFGWGRNSSHQVCIEEDADQSSPRQVKLLDNERARDIAAGNDYSLILTDGGLIYFMGKHSVGAPSGMVKISLPESPDCMLLPKQVFSSINLCGCVFSKYASNVLEYLTDEKIFLEQGLVVQETIFKILKHNKKFTVSEHYELLFNSYSDILYITTLNILSLSEYISHERRLDGVKVVQHVEEFCYIYRTYLDSVCGVMVVGGFTTIASGLHNAKKLPDIFGKYLATKKKSSAKVVVAHLLLEPLNRLTIYTKFVQCLLKDYEDHAEFVVCKKLQDSLVRWEQLCDEIKKTRCEADLTRQFWESSGKIFESLQTPKLRYIRDSRSHPITLLNAGRFASHWFILLTDILIHSSNVQTVFPLKTVWVKPLEDAETYKNAILLTMPEDSLTVFTPTPQDKVEWLQALQTAIRKSLKKTHSHTPPVLRSAEYKFTKHPIFKDATYTGHWLCGKMQGQGKITWPDGKTYVGQFVDNMPHGFGRQESPGTDGVTVYEGQWSNGKESGKGVLRYANGDVYEGYFKDGLPSGHGVYKQGQFVASAASVYIGEWEAGMKQGYGVMDDIRTGEKYLGMWHNNLKHGAGMIVTLDGIYYEGTFVNSNLTGFGIMVFEDSSYYEGDFSKIGTFNGKGSLVFPNGDKIEGHFYGAWSDGVKVNGLLQKTVGSSSASKPSSFGKLCVPPKGKWKAIFSQCYQLMGIEGDSQISNTSAWDKVAVAISNCRQEAHRRKSIDLNASDILDTIPCFGREGLNKEDYQKVQHYLSKAFESNYHPLGQLLLEVTRVYTATYGGVRVHPLLLHHAVQELHSITSRIYEVVRVLFPAFPPDNQEMFLDGDDEDESEVVSATSLLHPVLLPRVHSALFVLYALHNKQEDDSYWKRLLKWNKQPDISLMAFLGIDQKFWICNTIKSTEAGKEESSFSPLREQVFHEAVETLQQLKTTFSPLEKLQVIHDTFQEITKVVQEELGSTYLWNMDDLFPVFQFVVVRSRILQLGSEIHFIEDFMEPYLQNGELGIMFTTLKACYYQILQEKVSMTA